MNTDLTRNAYQSIIKRNSLAQKALKKCANIARDAELKHFFLSLTCDFRKINSLLLDTINTKPLGTPMEVNLLISCINLQEKKRWLDEKCIFNFDSDETLIEEVERAITVMCQFYQGLGLTEVERLLSAVRRESIFLKKNNPSLFAAAI